MNKSKNILKSCILIFVIVLVSLILFNQMVAFADSIGKNDSDEDGVDDSTEELIGSNKNYSLDVIEIKIGNKEYFLIDTNSDEVFEKIYDPVGKILSVNFDSGRYLIDLDQDRSYDYVYYNGEVSVFQEEVEQLQIPWILVIASLIIIALIVILILFKLGILYLYEEYADE